MNTSPSLFPIRVVSDQTGLSTHVIRAWESRYAAVEPFRTETNHRLYNQHDVDRLLLLRRLADQGHAIGTIATLSDEELLDQLSGPTPPAATPRARRGFVSVDILLNRCKKAILDYERETLENALMDANVEFTQTRLMDDFLGPLLNWIGEEWHSGELRVAQEHTATVGIRNFLGNLQLLTKTKTDAPRVVIATPSDEEHEIGALMACLIASARGWRSIYLGPRVPPQEIAAAVKSTSARMVAISATESKGASSFLQEANILRKLLPQEVPVVAGGAGTLNLREDFERMEISVIDQFQDFAFFLG